jgi:hypothetical protein
MVDKPTTASGYDAQQTARVRALCLYVATKLGDLMDDLVIAGGLVPTLLVDQEQRSLGVDPHAGTSDLDLGLSVLLLDEQRYRSLAERLRAAGFVQDRNPAGHPTRQRWAIERPFRVTMDFLIAPTRPEDRGGRLRDLEPDFAAVLAPGLHLAFRDYQRVVLRGATLFGESAAREINVCGPGAYVVLKALALRLRGENKDAYDLYYVVRNFASGPASVAERLRTLRGDAATEQALVYLREDFAAQDCIGPRRIAQFIVGDRDEAIHADAVAFVHRLLALTEEES